MAELEIGMGRSARVAYELDDVAIIPSRRTRSSSDVSTAWQIDAYRFEIPLVTQPADAIVSPGVGAEVSRLGGLAVLDGEGLWGRYPDAQQRIDDLIAFGTDADDLDEVIHEIQRLYAAEVSLDLLGQSIREMRAGGGAVAVRLSPQSASRLAESVIRLGAELLVIQGTITSAEHVRADGEALNLKSFIADLDVPVIAGGCTNYRSAIHLMRTGAAGVIVGTGDGATATTDDVLGIAVPMATAVADAAAARRAYLDETGGRYVHVIAAGGIHTSGDVAKAIACGADAVMLGEPLTWSQAAPAAGWYWPTSTAHPVVPRGFAAPCGPADVPLEQLLLGPATGADGRTNLFGALRRAMAKAGYSDLKSFQKVGLSVRT